MSFQDVGRPGAPRRPPQRSQLTTTQTSAPAPQQTRSGDPYAQLSDGILQYQRNVGILEKITRHIGTPEDGPELETQYDVQVDVLQQLGDKLEMNLRALETQLDQIPRTEAARRRATLVKLGRDFARIQAIYKNIVSETKRKRARLAQAKPLDVEQRQEPPTEEEERIQLELQLQQDRLNEEIMREREYEIRNINRGMHQVNEIYKDLANIVGSQQEQIDQIETQMEHSRANAEQGLKHIQKANEKASSSQCTVS